MHLPAMRFIALLLLVTVTAGGFAWAFSAQAVAHERDHLVNGAVHTLDLHQSAHVQADAGASIVIDDTTHNILHLVAALALPFLSAGFSFASPPGDSEVHEFVADFVPESVKDSPLRPPQSTVSI